MLTVLKRALDNPIIRTAVLCIIILIPAGKIAGTYLNLSFSFNNLWVVLLPFILYIPVQGNTSNKYGYLTIVAMGFYLIMPTSFFVFIALCFGIFYAIESNIGKINRLAPLVLILITPLTKYFLDVFGFPIRLKLSKMAAWILSLPGSESVSNGNSIILNGNTFSVDPGCMGLKMIITSFLLALFLLTYFEKKLKKMLSLQGVLLILFFTLSLIVFTNLIRIVSLIYVNSAPGTWSHEFVGIVCLISFTIIPLYFITKYLVLNYAIEKPVSNTTAQLSIKKVLFIILPCAFTLIAFTYKIQNDIPPDKISEQINITGFDKEVLATNIIKFNRPDAMIYIKPCKGAFRSNHNPHRCWKGSGYLFKNEAIANVNGIEVYTANLQSDKEQLYTAWWYDNGKSKTIGQFEWRSKMMSGEDSFRLINVTANSKEALIDYTKYLLNKNLFIVKVES